MKDGFGLFFAGKPYQIPTPKRKVAVKRVLLMKNLRSKEERAMRLFIAVTLSEEIQKELVRCMHDLKKQGVEGNYIPARNLHMTLAFIGEYDDPAKVKEVIKTVPLPDLRLSISDSGKFGNVLWAGVKGNQKLKTYVKDLRSALAANGIPCEKEKFVPHITLIRRISARKSYQIRVPKLEMAVRKVSLMKSEQKDGKTVYKEL